jgi:acylphosphatase
MTDCRRFIASGKVQGVFFRASTQAEAQRLGLTGHASNLANGCVEIVACGEARALDDLARWLRHGPPRARVEDLTTEPIECRPPSDFITR